MTSGEQQFNSSEHHIPKWEALDAYMRTRIRTTAVSIENASSRTAFEETYQLNNHFISDGLIGLRAKVKTSFASFVHTVITDDGVGEVPVYDIDLRGRDEFEGVFKGCVSDTVQADTSMNLLFYNVELKVEGYDQLHVRVPVDDGSILVEYEDKDNWDKEVDGAFAVLETVEDDEYQAIVEGLRDAFWNTDQPNTLRLRTIGVHAIDLLAHPLHVESSESVEALGTILLCSVDDELLYKVSGISSEETRAADGKPLVKVTDRRNPRVLKPVGVRYVTNFELMRAGDDDIDIALTDSLQPAFTFFDVKERVELDYPLRFLSDIEEQEYGEDMLTEARPVATTNINYGAIGGKTCGELSREYTQRNNL